MSSAPKTKGERRRRTRSLAAERPLRSTARQRPNLQRGRRHASRAARQQRWIAISASVAIVGLAVVGTGAGNFGAPIVIVGLLSLMWGVHRFGRLGSEQSSHARGDGLT
jgi:fatty acid desaturase